MERTGNMLKVTSDATKIDNNGYEVLRRNGRNKRLIYYHVVLAERILGRQLPKGALVHHINNIKLDNRPSNLLICPDREYHRLLHRRADALKADGEIDWLRCYFCKEHDSPENIRVTKHGSQYHLKCKSDYNRWHYQHRKRTGNI